MIPLVSGFGWGAVARIAVIGGVALAVWLGFQWFTGVLDENLELQMQNASLQSSLEIEQAARERAGRAAAEAVRRQTEISQRFNAYRQEIISEQHRDWRSVPLPDGLADGLRQLARQNGNRGNQGAAEPDAD